MEIILSGVLGELTTRSINFFISKFSKPPALNVEERLHRVLLRAQVILDEAMGRHITNQAMLQQLEMLRNAMHQGHYILDTFRYQSQDEENAQSKFVRQSLSLSKLNSFKGFRKTQISVQLQESLDNLSSRILDVEELVVFLMSYPRLYSQPYSMHLLLDKCMFGRQMETDQVINFLLHRHSYGAEELEVLPIVGPGRVGKTTLVGHVCKDESVCNHFSKIIFLRSHDFVDDELPALREGSAMKHQSHLPNTDKDGNVRLLVVVELVGELDEDAWNRLYSALKRSMHSSSKIIVTSRSDKIIKFGTTTQPLTLKYLSHGAYWYFFKTLTFGSMDPETHPRLMRLAMDISRTLNGSLIAAHVTARLLRDNFDTRFWLRVLVFLRESYQNHLSKFREHPVDLMNQNRPVRLGRMASPSEYLMVYYQHQLCSQEEVPEIKFEDVVYGRLKPHGKFEALAWRSQVPPYYSYVYACEIQELKTKAFKRKRSAKTRVALC